VADESVEGPTVAALRAAGHVVLSIAETTLTKITPGIEDTAVLAIARREKTLLLTADKDFGELVFRNGELHFGVLLIRSHDGNLEENAANALAAIEQHGQGLLNRFSVLSGSALRIRQARS
jgi:predicted nuclease of predicted toxin-antitoxin system